MVQLLYLPLAMVMTILGVRCIPWTSEIFADYWMYQERYDKQVSISGGYFVMGNRDRRLNKTGEYPTKRLQIKDFVLDKFPVTNAQFWKFMYRTPKNLKTRPQKTGSSLVFVQAVPSDAVLQEHVDRLPGEPWWISVREAKWSKPEGGSSNLTGRWEHPVVHVSQSDAELYCEWAGKRLPTEAEWEYAARAGAHGMPYPWGDTFKHNRTNLWQGLFPYENRASDGHTFVSPVDAYPAQNRLGLYDMIGNVWEWTSTIHRDLSARSDPTRSRGTPRRYILKGGSFIDFREDRAHINHAARISNRQWREETFSAQNIGFRCATDRLKRLPQFHRKSTIEALPTINYLVKQEL